MMSPRKHIIELVEQGIIPPEKVYAALSAVKAIPDGKAWKTFMDHLLLWLGSLSLAFAAIFFIAYNWNDMGHYAKFGMVEGCIGLAIAAYWKQGDNEVFGKVSLLTASLFLGVLLVLYGQTYQTGADHWQLFFNWALLILPWAFIGRFPTLWMVWITLINISIVTYHQVFQGVFWFIGGSVNRILWLVFFFNTFVIALWEVLALTWHWLSERWAICLLGMGSGIPITWLALMAVLDFREESIPTILAWVIWLAILYLVYRKIKPNLFMLAGGCLSGGVVWIAFLSRYLSRNFPTIGFLLFALLIIGMGGGAGVWLNHLHRKWES